MLRVALLAVLSACAATHECPTTGREPRQASQPDTRAWECDSWRYEPLYSSVDGRTHTVPPCDFIPLVNHACIVVGCLHAGTTEAE